ncbi:MAG: EamA family transporter [Pseudobdellovibrionaceae bacterium]
MEFSINKQVLPALMAAVLFGASTPFAKLLVGEIDPWVLAGILYFGSGLGLFVVLLIQNVRAKSNLKFPNKKDFLWLLGSTVFGGILGPVFLMKGLGLTSASTSSLLLNIEGVFTSTIAWLIFKEHYDRRIILGMMTIVFGGVILSWSSDGGFALTPGALWVIGACLCWAIDNNMTRNISAHNAVLITTLKSLIAGLTNLVLALFLRRFFPTSTQLMFGMVLGFLGYGLSIVFFVLSLRAIGTSRTGAYFSAAPFVGAVLSLVLFKNEISLQLVLAGCFMTFGVWLHLTETHVHDHAHDELYHTHEHIHDEHHQHAHSSSDPAGEKHTHPHQHEKLVHKHPHFPDIHHRHSH